MTLPRFAVLGLLALSHYVAANEQRVTVVDRHGEPLAGAAVAVWMPGMERHTDGTPTATAVIDQRDEQFIPALLVVRTGTTVEFPNNDTVMHHVYSFSPTKTFEIPLYQNRPPSPVRFEQPGLVVLGCNIHDQMIGHILVVDTPLFGVTDRDGTVSIADGPGGGAELLVWHPGLGDLQAAPRLVTGDGLTRVRLDVDARWPGTAGADGALSWHDY